jgi:hypothetical protein
VDRLTTHLDDGLTQIHRFGFEYGHGFSDHSPMVIEALEFAGHSAHIPVWLGPYLQQLDPTPPDIERREIERAEADCERLGLDEFVRQQIFDLADAVPSGAGHGVLRTSHALRSLRRHDTPERRSELIRSIAHWRLFRLTPAPVSTVEGRVDAATLMYGLSPQPGLHRHSFSDTLERVLTAEFYETIAPLALPEDPESASVEVIDLAAEAMFRGPVDGMLARLHGFTTAVALRELFETATDGAGPGTDATSPEEVASHELTDRMLRSVFSMIAGLWIGYGATADQAPVEIPAHPPATTEELVAAAIAQGSEHAIKVAVALAAEEEHRGGPSPALRRSVQRAVRSLGCAV